MKKKFTFIELVLVTSIVAILALLIVPNVVGMVSQAKEERIVLDANRLQEAVDRYKMNEGYYPTIVQPTDGNPQKIDVTKLTPDYIKKPPQSGDFLVDKDSTVIVPIECSKEYICIKTPEDLNNIRNDLEGRYMLMNNIDLSGYANWERIGNSTNPFNGSFEGNGFSISNLKMNIAAPNTQGYGLFGSMGSTGSIKKVSLDNVSIKVVDRVSNVGALVGDSKGIVEEVTSSGVIEDVTVYTYDYGYGGKMGGIIGKQEGGYIQDSHSTVSMNIPKLDWIGGVVGYFRSGDIINSYSTGQVVGDDFVGGLVGEIHGVNIENSYATGHVTGYKQVGGLVGQQGGDNSVIPARTSLIVDSYATGDVTGVLYSTNVGGFVGTISTVEGNDQNIIKRAYSTGNVVTDNAAGIGGFAGSVGNSILTEVSSSGNVSAPNTFGTGGLAGYVTYSSISKASATGTVEGMMITAGLIGSFTNSSLLDSYSSGLVVGTNFITGGLIGTSKNSTITRAYTSSPIIYAWSTGGLVSTDSTTTIVSSYFDTEKTGVTYVYNVDGTPKTTVQMKQASTYVGWDFVNVWTIKPGEYPTLR